MLRVCSSFPQDLDPTSKCIKSLIFTRDVLFRLSNMSIQAQREDEIAGCLQAVARNDSDAVTNWSSLTSNLEEAHFLPVTDQSPRLIISSYVGQTSESESDVLSSLDSLSLAVKLLTIALIVITAVVAKTHSRVYRWYKMAIAKKTLGIRAARQVPVQPPSCPLQGILVMVLFNQFGDSFVARSRGKSTAYMMLHAFLLLFVLWIHFFFVSVIKTVPAYIIAVRDECDRRQ